MADEPKQQPKPQSAPKPPVPPVEIDPQLGDYVEKMEEKPKREK